MTSGSSSGSRSSSSCPRLHVLHDPSLAHDALDQGAQEWALIDDCGRDAVENTLLEPVQAAHHVDVANGELHKTQHINYDEWSGGGGIEPRTGRTWVVEFRLGAWCVCVLYIKPPFLPVDIQHNQCPCRFYNPGELQVLCSQNYATEILH